jgi:hypothetical protein
MLPPDHDDNMDPGHEQDQEAAIQSPEHEADVDMAGQDDEVQDHDETAMDGAQIEQVDVTHAQIDEDLAHNQEDMYSLHDDQDQAEYEETNVDGIPIEPRAAREMQIDEEYDEEEDTEFMQDGQDQQYDETNSDELPVESEAAPDAQIDDHDQEDTEPMSDVPDQSHEDLRPQTNEPHDYVEAEAEAQADESNFQSAYVSEESDPSAAADAQIFQDEPAGGHQFREDSSSQKIRLRLQHPGRRFVKSHPTCLLRPARSHTLLMLPPRCFRRFATCRRRMWTERLPPRNAQARLGTTPSSTTKLTSKL